MGRTLPLEVRSGQDAEVRNLTLQPGEKLLCWEINATTWSCARLDRTKLVIDFEKVFENLPSVSLGNLRHPWRQI